MHAQRHENRTVPDTVACMKRVARPEECARERKIETSAGWQEIKRQARKLLRGTNMQGPNGRRKTKRTRKCRRTGRLVSGAELSFRLSRATDSFPLPVTGLISCAMTTRFRDTLLL